MKSALGTKLGILKFAAFLLYVGAGIIVAIFVWAISSSNNPGSEIVFLIPAAGIGLLGLICDVVCDMAMNQIRNEQRQERILAELKNHRP